MTGGDGLFGTFPPPVNQPSLTSRRIPAIVTAANLGICIAYWAFERSVPKLYRPPLGKDAHLREGVLKRKISWNTLNQL